MRVSMAAAGGSAARGAALVEFYIVALFALLPFCMAILQTAVLLSAKNILNHATFAAARAGALEQGSRTAMLNALARGLMPLHVRSAEELHAGNVVEIATEAYARSYADTLAFARLRVLNPPPAAFEDFGTGPTGARTIRNDSLEFRSIAKGARSGLSIQEANVLDIRVRYCQPLIFPLIDRLLVATLRRVDLAPDHQLCYALRRVPLAARGIVHMQSDPREAS
jgi:hypothetical protein